MLPKYAKVDAHKPDRATIGAAARMLRQGALVVFPTETVYGLGAAATNDEAVGRVFDVKGRPRTNPLIVHVARIAQAQALAEGWSDDVDRLAHAFWPGPLTLVVPRSRRVSDLVTGGVDSVALRIPSHPVARELLILAAIPIVAPSANRYQHVSPTTAQHVIDDLGDRVDLVLDGGPTPIGIESTVVSLLADGPRILRMGSITPDVIATVVPRVQWEPVLDDAPIIEPAVKRSPGQVRRHYAPSARIELVGQVQSMFIDGDDKVGWLVRGPEPGEKRLGTTLVIVLPDDPARYAAALYAALHRFDAEGCTRVLVEKPPTGVRWDAVRDRLLRASMPPE